MKISSMSKPLVTCFRAGIPLTKKKMMVSGDLWVFLTMYNMLVSVKIEFILELTETPLADPPSYCF